MRTAFVRSLAAEVADTMAFIGESVGREGIERVRMAGSDRFEISNFRKIDCQPMAKKSGFDCAFTVNITLVNGPMERSLNGRFFNTPERIQFELDEAPHIELSALAESTQGRYTETKVALKKSK